MTYFADKGYHPQTLISESEMQAARIRRDAARKLAREGYQSPSNALTEMLSIVELSLEERRWVLLAARIADRYHPVTGRLVTHRCKMCLTSYSTSMSVVDEVDVTCECCGCLITLIGDGVKLTSWGSFVDRIEGVTKVLA